MTLREFINEVEETDQGIDQILEQKTGAQIAKELGITRAAVSNTLKRGMGKAFKEFQKMMPDMNAFEVAVAMSIGFGVDETELKKFFRLFPPDIRKKIETDALESMPHLKGEI